MHLEVDQKYYLWQEEEDGLVHPVLDSLDNYKMLSERMNVLTIYLANIYMKYEINTVENRVHHGVHDIYITYIIYT